MIVAWAFYYAYASFISLPEVPWAICDNKWNNNISNCVDYGEEPPEELKDNSTTPSQAYF